jgi:hypothetical protein
MACRRCSECVGAEHHWIDNPGFGNDEDDDDPEMPGNPDYTHTCKHCPALGSECSECDGDGVIGVPVFEADDTEETCPKCDGHGVIEGLACTDWRGS